MVLALAHDQPERFGVLLDLGDFARRLPQQLHQLRGRVQTVETVLSRTPVVHEAGLFQLRQMGRDVALSFGKNVLQFRDGELLLFEEKQQPQPVGIGGQTERFQD